MNLLERLNDSISALGLRTSHFTVHTEDGNIGVIENADVLKGTVTLKTATEKSITVRAGKVTDLDQLA